MAAKSANPTRPGRCEGEERKKALSVALANIEKQFGKGAIMRMADGAEVEDIETVSTGSLGLDLALGVGGLPRGRIIEVFGPESSGKTTPCRSSPKCRRSAVRAPSLTRNTRSTSSTHSVSACSSPTF